MVTWVERLLAVELAALIVCIVFKVSNSRSVSELQDVMMKFAVLHEKSLQLKASKG